MSGNAPKFDHPCFTNAPARAARMHLSVAPKCNIKCSFCNPAGGDKCVHGCMPGLTDRVLSPREALEHVRRVRDGGIDIRIVGIAGPGEPLFNEETFETIALVREAFPSMHICLSTNGLLLPERLSRILSLGVETLTVTVNCLTVDCARRVYDHVEGRRDDASFERLLRSQLEGVRFAAEAGLCVKVNSVLLPGENDAEIPLVARRVADLGAYIHNVLPLIPRPDARRRAAPQPGIGRQCARAVRGVPCAVHPLPPLPCRRHHRRRRMRRFACKRFRKDVFSPCTTPGASRM